MIKVLLGLAIVGGLCYVLFINPSVLNSLDLHKYGINLGVNAGTSCEAFKQASAVNQISFLSSCGCLEPNAQLALDNEAVKNETYSCFEKAMNTCAPEDPVGVIFETCVVQAMDSGG